MKSEFKVITFLFLVLVALPVFVLSGCAPAFCEDKPSVKILNPEILEVIHKLQEENQQIVKIYTPLQEQMKQLEARYNANSSALQVLLANQLPKEAAKK